MDIQVPWMVWISKALRNTAIYVFVGKRVTLEGGGWLSAPRVQVRMAAGLELQDNSLGWVG